MNVEEDLVGEWLEVQKVELPLQVCYVSAHWRSCHAPPVQRKSDPTLGHTGPISVKAVQVRCVLSLRSLCSTGFLWK